jgi:excisionase family DNA binding protein
MQQIIQVFAETIRAQVLDETRKIEEPFPRPRLMTAAQAGAYLGRSEAAVRQLIAKRQLPVVRFGRNVRIDVQDLDRLIDEYKV